ncbi:hypothetical protein MPTK1_7g00625 [Marchantia polymorpha subsp. ruderalis]
MTGLSSFRPPCRSIHRWMPPQDRCVGATGERFLPQGRRTDTSARLEWAAPAALERRSRKGSRGPGNTDRRQSRLQVPASAHAARLAAQSAGWLIGHARGRAPHLLLFRESA